MSDDSKKFKIKKIFSGGSNERRVRAFDNKPNSIGLYPVNIFPVSFISRLSGLGGMSTIHLQDGVTIPVALSCDELSRRIYEGEFSNTAEVDLGDVTGADCVVRDIVPIGTKMDDGTIYAGISAEANAPLLLMPKADEMVTYRGAQRYIDKMNNSKAGGHSDWRLPTYGELYKIAWAALQFKDAFNIAAQPVHYWSGYKPAVTYSKIVETAYALLISEAPLRVNEIDVETRGGVLAVRCPKI